MAISRSWRTPAISDAPVRATMKDVPELNEVFSVAFTERYRRDGLTGVRVPYLNPAIWRYAIEDAAEGALLWRDARGAIAAFNMIHQSGTEGWMGPLAVRSDHQGHGVGKEVVGYGIEWLKSHGATVIGLETMPRTMDNIGFYSRLGFSPSRLTLTLALDAARFDGDLHLLSRMSGAAVDDALRECRELVGRMLPGSDYTREITLTRDLELGETMLLREGGRLAGFALAHLTPLVEGRSREELRVLKLAVADEASFGRLARLIANHARQMGVRRVSFRMQGEYRDAYRQLVSLGAHVRWSDLRMSLDGYDDRVPGQGMVLSNWEI